MSLTLVRPHIVRPRPPGLVIPHAWPGGIRAHSTLYNGLASYWPMSEPSGVRYDLVGGNHLSPTNTPTGTTGPIAGSNAVQCVGASTQYLSRAPNASLHAGTNGFCVAAWCYLDTKPAFANVIGMWSGGGNFEWVVYYQGGGNQFIFTLSSTGADTTNITAKPPGDNLQTGVWYLVVFGYSALRGLQVISVNNRALKTAAYTLGVYNSSANFGTGGTDGGAPWDGRIGPVALWRGRVLQPLEIEALWNDGRGLAWPWAA